MKSNLIKSGERLDDLQLNNLKLIQNPSWFCFGIDAVLLSDFSAFSIKKGKKLIKKLENPRLNDLGNNLI